MKIKNIITIVLLLCSLNTLAQQYEISYDSSHGNERVLTGIINKEILKNDTAFKWYRESQKIYNNPDTAIVAAFERNKSSVNFIIFGGTWCEDSQFILPKFFMLQERADITDDHITLFAVNRKKQTFGNITTAMDIINVPTIIVMKNGKEKGRVVEYGKTGKWDKELADILNQ